MRNRTLLLVGLLAALVLAGVVSYYASSEPDGLNRVAGDQGFSRTETDHRAADGPFAGYTTRGVDDGRLSGGLAGIVGTVVVLALAGGLAWGVRRRASGESRDDSSDERTPAGKA